MYHFKWKNFKSSFLFKGLRSQKRRSQKLDNIPVEQFNFVLFPDFFFWKLRNTCHYELLILNESALLTSRASFPPFKLFGTCLRNSLSCVFLSGLFMLPSEKLFAFIYVFIVISVHWKYCSMCWLQRRRRRLWRVENFFVFTLSWSKIWSLYVRV